MPPDARVGVIGGGFTGSMLAVHLARAARSPLTIEIIEPRVTLGSGLAYGSCGPEHLINVPSDRMSVFAEDPSHFARWIADPGSDNQARRPSDGNAYPRRSDFGAYVRQLVAAAGGSGSQIRHLRAAGHVLAREAAGWSVGLDNGDVVSYDHMVLCVTHGPPAFRWGLSESAQQLPHLIRDPWDVAAVRGIPHGASVLIIGSGLTMCDAVATLRASGHVGPVHVVSRRGLTPRPHGEFDTTFDLFQGRKPPMSALGLLRSVRKAVADLERDGRTWHVAIDSVRRQLPSFWTSLPTFERRKIARRLKTYWDVHRFRMAPQVADLLADGRRDGWLSMEAARVTKIGREDHRFVVFYIGPSGIVVERRVDAIINSTGPDSDISRSINPLLLAAQRDGFIRPDSLRLGIDVDANGAVISSNGLAEARLWASGPLARSFVGEATGVPEASAHARKVASSILFKLQRENAEEPRLGKREQA